MRQKKCRKCNKLIITAEGTAGHSKRYQTGQVIYSLSLRCRRLWRQNSLLSSEQSAFQNERLWLVYCERWPKLENSTPQTFGAPPRTPDNLADLGGGGVEEWICSEVKICRESTKSRVTTGESVSARENWLESTLTIAPGLRTGSHLNPLSKVGHTVQTVRQAVGTLHSFCRGGALPFEICKFTRGAESIDGGFMWVYKKNPKPKTHQRKQQDDRTFKWDNWFLPCSISRASESG